MGDLYAISLKGVPGKKACGGNNGDEGEACALVQPIPGHAGAVALSDSKNPGRGDLRFTGEEMTALVRTYARANDITL
jgi:hypothetical protein